MTQRYTKYKDSGIEWIGEIPEHWEVRKLKSFTGFVNRGSTPYYVDKSEYFVINQATFSKGFFDLENIKYTNETEIGFQKNRGRVKINDLLIASTGGGVLGKVAHFDIPEGRFIADGHVTIVRIHENKGLNKYLYYLLSINFDLINELLAQGSTNQTELQRDWLLNFNFPLPPLPEQEAIAQFLDEKCARIDDAVRIKEKQIDLLKEYRQIAIHQAVTKGLNDQVKMKDSGIEWIGEIPEHWEVKKNKELFTEINEPGNAELPILSVSIHTAVSNDELNEDENIRGKIRIEDKSNYKLVEKRDVVFNMMRAWQGAIGVVHTKGMVSPAYVVARPIQSVNSDFLEYEFRNIRYIQIMNRVSKGITDFRKRLYWNEFKQLETIIPPLAEQTQIVAHLESLTAKTDEAIHLKKQQIEQLKQYKNSLINEVVTGKIRVF